MFPITTSCLTLVISAVTCLVRFLTSPHFAIPLLLWTKLRTPPPDCSITLWEGREKKKPRKWKKLRSCPWPLGTRDWDNILLNIYMSFVGCIRNGHRWDLVISYYPQARVKALRIHGSALFALWSPSPVRVRAPGSEPASMLSTSKRKPWVFRNA